jgi:hypothetical protein
MLKLGDPDGPTTSRSLGSLTAGAQRAAVTSSGTAVPFFLPESHAPQDETLQCYVNVIAIDL